jgi:hypothetical protein
VIGWRGWLLVPAWLVASSTAFAAEPVPESRCPSREAIAQAVRALLSRSRASVDVESIDRELVIQDLGERYMVEIRGRKREYADDARDCSKRARVSAVFVALTVAPPDIALPDLPPEPAPEPALPRAPPPRPPPPRPEAATRTWWSEIEVGAWAGAAPRNDHSVFVMGGELRLGFTGERLGFGAGAAVSTPSTLEFGNVRVRVARYPFDLGARLRWSGPVVAAWIDVGAVASWLQVRALDVADARTTWRLEPGARAAFTMAAQGAWMPYLRVFTEIVPAPYEVALEPRGPVGKTSAVWLGLSIGVTGKFP